MTTKCMCGVNLMKNSGLNVIGCIVQKTIQPKFSVMFWGCITYFGVGTLTPVKRNMNSVKYIEVLDENLWPVIA